MEAVVIPDNARAFAENLARAVEVPAGGRLELVFDDDMRCVDAYIKPRNERRTPRELEATSIFCSCITRPSVLHGRCIVCGLPQRPAV